MQWFFLGAFYMVVAIRFGIILFRTERRIGRTQFYRATFMAAIWPLVIIMLGFGIAMDGNAGIFDSQYLHH